MSPVTLDDNCTQIKALETEALLSYSVLIFTVTTYEMNMSNEGSANGFLHIQLNPQLKV